MLPGNVSDVLLKAQQLTISKIQND